MECILGFQRLEHHSYVECVCTCSHTNFTCHITKIISFLHHMLTIC